MKKKSKDNDILSQIVNQVENKLGKGAIMRLGDNKAKGEVSVIPTEIFTLDMALGVGGLPKGRMVEIFGPESSGKTTLCLQMIANVQASGGIAAFVDVEHALESEWAKLIGVDINNLLLSQPDCGEQALELVDMLAKRDDVDIIVLDSVAALASRAELEGEMGNSHIGLQARLMSQAMRKLTAVVSQSNTIIIFVNQIREKIGVMFGSPEVTPGGRALKFYSSMRLDIRRIGSVKSGSDIIGNRVRVKVVKNKVAPPFKTAEFDILYNKGISKEGALIDVAIDKDVITKKGAWYFYKDEQIAQGRLNTIEYLKENKDFAKSLSDDITKCLKGETKDE